jgi:preprotein translocase subunit YajC
MDLPLPLLFAQAALFDPKGMLIPIVGTLGIMYFLVIRPQQKQAKETTAMLASLKKGDDVVTSGGLLGKVHQVDDKLVTLDVGGGTKLRILKSAVASKATVEAPKAEAAESKKEEK